MTQTVATIENDATREIAPATGNAVTPMDLLQKAMDTGADLDKLEKLMDMQERWEAGQARKAFVAAKAAFKAEAPKIDKNKTVDFTSQKGRTTYKHATLGHIEELLAPVLSKHGLSYSWETEQAENGQIRVTCVLTHTLGHNERVTLQSPPDASGNKNSIQAIGSAATFLSRYTLLLAVGMTTDEMDDDGATLTDKISDQQKSTLVDLIKKSGADTGKLLSTFGAPSLDDLPAVQFQPAQAMLLAKINKAMQDKKAEGGDA